MPRTRAIRNRIIETRQVRAGDLIPNPKNWRTHPQAQADAMRGLLTEIGYTTPLMAVETPDGLMLVDGHLRAETTPDALVPVSVVDLTPDEADEVLATHDPIAAMAGQDDALLASLLDTVASRDAAVQALLADLRGPMPKVGRTDPDAVPDPPEPRTKPGDLWLLGDHRLLCGDSTSGDDLDRLMDGHQADCVFTSPPYGVGVDYGGYDDTLENLRAMLPLLSASWARVVVAGGFAVVNFGDIVSGRDASESDEPCEYPMALEYWPAFRADGWSLWSRRVWCKPAAGTGSMQCIGSNRAATNWEHVWTWKRPGRPIIDVQLTGEYPSQMGWFDTTHDHQLGVGLDEFGAGMPVAVAERSIAMHARAGAAVIEPFTGSGTTLMACERLSRRCYAMELEPRFVDITLRRWEEYTGQEAVLA